jgi:diguanylate cyclase (GGDEF)-like protein/PAS domain S-box-containing protein
VYGADGEVVESNDRARQLLGIAEVEASHAPRQPVMLKIPDRTTIPVDRQPVAKAISRRELIRDVVLIESQPAVRELWLEASALPVLDDDGVLECIVLTLVDVTDSRQRQAKLESEVERLELVLTSTRLARWDFDVIADETVIDERWAAMVGYRVDELAPVDESVWRRLCHPDDYIVAAAAMRAHTEGRTPYYDILLRLRHKDGHWVWVRDRGKVVRWAPDGRPLRVTGTHEDVTESRQAEQAHSMLEDESRLAFEHSAVATCWVGNDDRLIRVNPAFCELMARSAEELTTMSYLDLTHPDDVAVGASPIRDVVEGRRSRLRLKKRYVTGMGRVICADVTVSAVRAPDGNLLHRIAQLLDVTEEQRLQSALSESERIAHLGHWRLDLATNVVEWSPALFDIFGVDRDAGPPGRAELQHYFTHESRDRLNAAGARTIETGEPYVLDLEIVRGDGSHGWVEARGEAVRDVRGNIVELQGVSLDVTSRRQALEALAELATHDPLTGLPNRTVMLEEITRAVSAAARSERTVAVVMLDVDKFKDVNDTFGHAAGDQFLVEVAGRMKATVRGADLVARLGGDEFVVVMREVADASEAVRTAERLRLALRTPIRVGDSDLFSTLSAGISIAGSGSRAGDLMREADTAMYAAKAQGRDRVMVFNEDLRTIISTRMDIEDGLRIAVASDQLDVWYQPEVDLVSGEMTAVEALVRWHHPSGSVWTADQFIPVAEDTGLIVPIGSWVLHQACMQGAEWVRARPLTPPLVRVNVSALQLNEADLLASLDSALASSGLRPELLCIEITETALLRRNATVTGNLEGIHSRGILIAIDDFGTGYSSLTHLHDYPVQAVKVDRSFITNPNAPDHDHRLVAGIIALAHTLGISVTAEGVEHPVQAEHLRELGCQSAQGALFAMAMPPEQITPLLETGFPMDVKPTNGQVDDGRVE